MVPYNSRVHTYSTKGNRVWCYVPKLELVLKSKLTIRLSVSKLYNGTHQYNHIQPINPCIVGLLVPETIAPALSQNLVRFQ